jgi:hypothetical protein
MYFLENSLDDKYSFRIESLLEYFTYLLLIFDRILIPAEHITISKSTRANFFKEAFFKNEFTKALLESHKIISTIWSYCDDLYTHLDASSRYLNEVGASKHYNGHLKKEILDMDVFKRDAGKQSQQAKGKFEEIIYTPKWRSIVDKLRYEDGAIVIPFSHEKLILGKSHEAHASEFINKAIEAYIYAMPAGNGRIYRSRIYGLESISVPITIAIDQRDFISQFCLDPPCLQELFINALKFNRVNANHFSSRKWINYFIKLTESDEMVEFRTKLIDILKDISRTLISDFNQVLKNEVRIIQSKWHNPKLVAAVIKALIEMKPATLIYFIIDYFQESNSIKYYYLMPYVRNNFNKIWTYA